jgi:hypothetical protein
MSMFLKKENKDAVMLERMYFHFTEHGINSGAM